MVSISIFSLFALLDCSTGDIPSVRFFHRRHTRRMLCGQESVSAYILCVRSFYGLRKKFSKRHTVLKCYILRVRSFRGLPNTFSTRCTVLIFLRFVCQIVPWVAKGFQDPQLEVRLAACWALTQFAEFLQPELMEHHEELLPGILTTLSDNNALVQKR